MKTIADYECDIESLEQDIKEMEAELETLKINFALTSQANMAERIERDRVMRENAKLNCDIDDLEMERDRLREALQELSHEMNHALVFIETREKMHPDGVISFKSVLEKYRFDDLGPPLFAAINGPDEV